MTPGTEEPGGQQLLCPWDSPGKNIRMGYSVLLQGIFLTEVIEPTSLVSPALAGRFFTTASPGKPKKDPTQPKTINKYINVQFISVEVVIRFFVSLRGSKGDGSPLHSFVSSFTHKAFTHSVGQPASQEADMSHLSSMAQPVSHAGHVTALLWSLRKSCIFLIYSWGSLWPTPCLPLLPLPPFLHARSLRPVPWRSACSPHLKGMPVRCELK